VPTIHIAVSAAKWKADKPTYSATFRVSKCAAFIRTIMSTLCAANSTTFWISELSTFCYPKYTADFVAF
jgi:hypothetical protein